MISNRDDGIELKIIKKSKYLSTEEDTKWFIS